VEEVRRVRRTASETLVAELRLIAAAAARLQTSRASGGWGQWRSGGGGGAWGGGAWGSGGGSSSSGTWHAGGGAWESGGSWGGRR